MCFILPPSGVLALQIQAALLKEAIQDERIASDFNTALQHKRNASQPEFGAPTDTTRVAVKLRVIALLTDKNAAKREETLRINGGRVYLPFTMEDLSQFCAAPE